VDSQLPQLSAECADRVAHSQRSVVVALLKCGGWPVVELADSEPEGDDKFLITGGLERVEHIDTIFASLHTLIVRSNQWWRSSTLDA
jgi:hypothetical protein